MRKTQNELQCTGTFLTFEGNNVGKHRFRAKDFFVEPDSKMNLKKINTVPGDEFNDRAHAEEAMGEDLSFLQIEQEKLYAEDKQSLIIILQGMDAAGRTESFDMFSAASTLRAASFTRSRRLVLKSSNIISCGDR